MSAKLPITRPVRSDFGPTFANAKPVRRPTNELDATSFNNLADELTQIAKTAAKAVVRVDSTGAILSILGIESSDVAIGHGSTGVYTFNFTDAGFNPETAELTVNSAALPTAYRAEISGATVTVYMFNLSAANIDAGFTLTVR